MDFLKIADGTVSLSTHSIENYTKSFIYEHQFESSSNICKYISAFLFVKYWVRRN